MTSVEREAVLVTGLFGTGKTSVVVEMADILEKRGDPYAALDLDWLSWCAVDPDDDEAEHNLMLRNLAAVLDNYRSAGARRFAMARALRSREELDGLRDVVAMPLQVVELRVSREEIERRLHADAHTGSGRLDDLRDVAKWISEGEGSGFADLEVSNEDDVRRAAMETLRLVGWDAPLG
jgi:MoxR-like ATPase